MPLARPLVRVPRPVPVALAVAGAVLLGGLGAVDRSAERAARQEAAATARAERAYLEALRPVAATVYDQVQPLHDALEADGVPDPWVAQVRDDVLERGGARPVLLARRSELARAEVPLRYADQAAQLVAALDDLARAAGLLAEDARTGPVSDLDARELLAAATRTWSGTVASLYAPRAAPPPVPGLARTARVPLSRGGYLYEADRVCSTTAGRPGRAAAVSLRPEQAREVVQRLRALPRPPAERGALARGVDAELAALDRALLAADGVLARLRAGGGEPSPQDRAVLSAVDLAADRVARAYASYGAGVCADSFDT